MAVFQDVDPSVRLAEMRRGLEEQLVIRQQISEAVRETLAHVRERQAREAERRSMPQRPDIGAGA